MASSKYSSQSLLRVSSIYAWPFDHSVNSVWCSSTLYSNASTNLIESSHQQQQQQQNGQSTDAAFVLDRASLAFASSVLLALSPFSDSFSRVSLSSCGEASPVKVIVRIRLEIDNPGFEATLVSKISEANGAGSMSEFLPLPTSAIGALDSELIPTLFNVAQVLGSKLPIGGLCFELTLFAMPYCKIAPVNDSEKSLHSSIKMESSSEDFSSEPVPSSSVDNRQPIVSISEAAEMQVEVG